MLRCLHRCHDPIMDKVGAHRGLIRYSTENALTAPRQNRRHITAPAHRASIHAILIVAAGVASWFSLAHRPPLKVDVIRDHNALAGSRRQQHPRTSLPCTSCRRRGAPTLSHRRHRTARHRPGQQNRGRGTAHRHPRRHDHGAGTGRRCKSGAHPSASKSAPPTGRDHLSGKASFMLP